MTINDKFLDAYKQLESELKYSDKTVLDYEGTLQGAVAEKLKSCRIMRNYMAHNDLDFLTATNNQIKFLNEHINLIKKSAQLVKNATKKIPLTKETEQLKNVATTLKKYGIVPVQTKNGIYLVDSMTFVYNFANGNKKLAIPAKLPKYKYISPNERLSEVVAPETYIVTDDGTAKGKYIGMLIV